MILYLEWSMIMKIVVLSDTHLPKRAKSLPPRLIEELVNADLISISFLQKILLKIIQKGKTNNE
jgi:hypothetical protein